MKENKGILIRKEKGITLIALVITIIVLLILAGVSIAMLTGENGILTQAQKAKEETEKAQAKEENILANYESVLNTYSRENTEFTDTLGNKVKVPSGFKVVNPEDNVEDGIIIEDVTHGATVGSQFVWIPVGTIQTSKGEVIINLDRYTFSDEGTEISQGDNEIKEESGQWFHELGVSNYGNVCAKNITEFISKVNNSKGYYIGRYEARTATLRNNKDNPLTQLTEKQEDYIYNYVTQPQAVELSRNMYSDSNFTSDLVNSYAWDTALVFIQKCSNKPKYSLQNSLNTEELAENGTTEDIICNIYDIASNCCEWTTETNCDSTLTWICSNRGGGYSDSQWLARGRGAQRNTNSVIFNSFRPILYL